MRSSLFYIIFALNVIFPQSVLSERYTTYEELEQKILEWDQEYGSNSDPFPNISNEGIIFHHEVIGYSGVDNLPIWAIKLSFNANIDEDEPKTLILGQCHAEEIYGIEIAVELIEWLLDPFGSANPIYIQSLLAILNSSEVWIIPTHNPDGLSVVHGWYDSLGIWHQDESFRKNKYDANNNGIFDFIQGIGDDIDGVDLNRNYDFNWIFGDDINQVDTGCSANPSYLSNYDYYRGPYPFSEPEIIAVRDFALENNFLLSIAYHSSRSGCVSEKVISPWLWEEEKAAPDLEIISRLGEEIAQLIPSEDGFSYYYPGNSTSMRGNAHDWFYKQTGCFQYLIEVGTSDMQPNNVELIESTIDRNMVGLLYMLKKAAGTTIQNGPPVYQLSGKVTNATGEPIDAEVKILELDGPMLDPRLTDEFGRFRRILIEGQFTLEVSAPGYQTYLTSISPSSSSITYHDIQLDELPMHDINIQIVNPEGFESIKGIIVYDKETDHIAFDNLFETFTYPEGQYRLKVYSTDPHSFPEFIDFILDENIQLNIYLKSKNILFEESFDNLNNWENFNSSFIIDNGYLKSQLSDYYESNLNESIRALINTNDYELNELGENFIINIYLRNELEWDNDRLSIFLESEDLSVSETIKVISGHDFSDYLLSIPYNKPIDNLYLKLLFESDNTVNYRGFYIDNIKILYPSCAKGDLDLSGNFDVIDIITLVNVILGIEVVFEGNVACRADLNNDEISNVIDIVSLVEIILNN